MRQSLRMLARDWRAGELRVLAAALAIAVAAITSVAFFADRVGQGLARDAHQLLGADLVLVSDRPWSRQAAAALCRPCARTAFSTSSPNGWSDTITRSAPRSWCASRTSAWLTRSPKNATLVMLATAITSAPARMRSSPARQSRASMRSDCLNALTGRPGRRRCG